MGETFFFLEGIKFERMINKMTIKNLRQEKSTITEVYRNLMDKLSDEKTYRYSCYVQAKHSGCNIDQIIKLKEIYDSYVSFQSFLIAERNKKLFEIDIKQAEILGTREVLEPIFKREYQIV